MCHLHWHISARLFSRKGGTAADIFDQRVLCSMLVGADSQRLVKIIIDCTNFSLQFLFFEAKKALYLLF